MKNLVRLALFSALLLAPVFAAHAETGVAPETALTWLTQGNARYASGKALHPRQDGARRKTLVDGQKPYAVVIGCSDSRVPPEILFDQGLGNLFVIRIAGNVVDETALGSIEYAVEHLGVRLVYVLGHKKCGAVKATLEAYQKNKYPNDHVLTIAKMILPSVKTVQTWKGDVLVNAISENVRRVGRELTASKPLLSEKIRTGKVKVHGGVYDLDTGKVNPVY